MNAQNRCPRWHQLRLLVPLMAGLLLLDAHLRLSQAEHQVIEVGVVLLMYSALACWLWANQAALESETDQAGAWHRIEPAEEQASNEMRSAALVEQTATNRSQLVEPVPLPAELLQVLSRETIRCVPPSGARLN